MKAASFSLARTMLISALVLPSLGCGCRQDKIPGPASAKEAPLSSARVLLSHGSVAAGGRLQLGILIELAEGWHTYADPPGESGMAPVLRLDLPAGIEAGEMEYPPAQTFADESGTTYGYEDSVLLRVPLSVAGDAVLPDPVDMRLELDYLVCREVCVPQQAALKLSVRAAADLPESVSSQWAQALAAGGWDYEQGAGRGTQKQPEEE